MRKYYRAKFSMYIDAYPFSIPRNSLYTENEIHRFRLDELPDFNTCFDTVKLKPRNTFKLWYDFRFEKEE